MAYHINAELQRIANAAADKTVMFRQHAIRPCDLLLALLESSDSEIGQILRRYIKSFSLYEAVTKLEPTTEPTVRVSPERPAFTESAITMFRDGASVAEHFGRREVTPVDLTYSMICFKQVIDLLLSAGVNPQDYAALETAITALLPGPKPEFEGEITHAGNTVLQ